MNEEPLFDIVYLEEAYNFLLSQSEKVQDKIAYNITKSMYYINKDIFKKLENTDIWEFRTVYDKMAYRLFAFWDNDDRRLVVATHGIIKKTQKTPRKEIEKAEAVRREYFARKDKK